MEVYFYIFTASICLLCLFRPGYSISYIFGFLTYEQWLQSKSAYFIYNAQIVNYSALLILLFGIAGKVQKGEFQYRIPANTKWIYLLYGYALMSLAWSPEFEIAIANVQTALPYLALYLLAAPIVLTKMADFEDLKRGFVFLLVPLLFACVFFASWDYRVMKPAVYVSDMKLNPLAVSMFGGILFGFCMLILCRKSMLRRVGAWILAAVCLLLIVKTESRGQFIALLLSVPLLILYRSGRLSPKSIVVAFVFGSVLVFGSAYLVDNYSQDFRWDEERIGDDYVGRLDAAERLISVWLDSPAHWLTGLGLSASYSQKISGGYVHIVPLEILGELGLIGLAIFIGGVISFLLRARRVNFLLESSLDYRSELFFYAFIFLYSLLLSLKQGSLLGSAYVFFSAVVAGKFMECLTSELGNEYSLDICDKVNSSYKV